MGLATLTDPRDHTLVRDAATLIVLRDKTHVLMGQRGATAAFLPGKFVFPGGAVDASDKSVPTSGLNDACAARLANETSCPGPALAAAAIRELWEETGQILGQSAMWPDPPRGWRGFAANGHIPHTACLSFFFRAVTPVGRPRRFDARFFLADAGDLVSDPDDFREAQDELSHLQWVPLEDARTFNLPFITKVVLAELKAYLTTDGPIQNVPFVRNDDEAHMITRLAGKPVL